jgi:hypothetical protein
MDLTKLPAWKKTIIGIILTALAIAGYGIYTHLSISTPSYHGWDVVLILFFIPLFLYVYFLFVRAKTARTKVSFLFTYVLILFLIVNIGPGLMRIDPTRADQVIIALLLISLPAIIIYFRLYPVMYPLTPDEHADTKQREFTLNLPYDEAFQLCLRSFQTFPFGADPVSDPANGTILADLGTGQISITLRRIDSHKTAIVISATEQYPESGRYIEQRTRTLIRALDQIQEFCQKNQTAGMEYQYQETDDKKQFRAGTCNFSKSIPTAVILSVLIPGLGQSYNGKYFRGFGLLIAAAIGLLAFIMPGLLVWIYGIYDSYKTARAMNEGKIPYVPTTVWILLIHFFIGTVLVISSVLLFFIIYWGKAAVQMITVALGGPAY